MDDHKLSLVVPAFNEERTIEAVLDKVFQYLPDVHEVLVIDDASDDRTPEVCHAYTIREQRVKLYRHKTNLGKTAALQTGFAACTRIDRGRSGCGFGVRPPRDTRTDRARSKREPQMFVLVRALWFGEQGASCIFDTFWRINC